MKTRIIAAILTIGIIFSIVTLVISYSGGPPAAMTNAPGESNCTSCHSGSLNPNTSNLTNLLLLNNFTGGGFIPDSSYTLTVKYKQTGISRWGFQITCLTPGTNIPAGNFTAGTGSAHQTAFIAGRTREYLNHSSTGNGGPDSVQWTFTWRAPSFFTDTSVFYVVVNATNNNFQNTGDQIYAKEFRVGRSNLLPTATPKLSRDTVCAGDTVTYLGSGTNNPTRFRWRFRMGNPSIVDSQNVVRIHTIPGTYTDTLWVTNNKGQSAPATTRIVVLPAPSASINIVPNDTVCEGETVTLQANFGSGLRYRWNTSSPADTLVSLQVTKSGSYTVTVTNNLGCRTTSEPADIVVLPKPSLNITSSPVDDTLCAGSILTLNFSSNADSFRIFDRGNLLATTSATSFKIDSVVPGMSLTVLPFKNGCPGNTSSPINKLIINRLSAPVIQCANVTTSSITFSWGNVAGATGYEVSFDNGQNWASPSSGNQGLSHEMTGLNFEQTLELWVRAKSPSPCFTGEIGKKSCTTLPCATFTFELVSDDSIYCAGAEATLEIKNLSINRFATRFNGGNWGNSLIHKFTPPQSGSYMVEILDSNTLNCPPRIRNVFLEVERSFGVSLKESSNNPPPCEGNILQFEADPGFTRYQFILNGNIVQSGSGNIFQSGNITNGASLKTSVDNGKRCSAESNELIIGIAPRPKSGFTLNTNNREVTATDTTSNISSRNWDFTEQQYTNAAASQVHNFSQNGNFDITLFVTDMLGCKDTSSQSVSVTNTGLSGFAAFKISAYPNPFGSTLHIALPEQNRYATLCIYSINGVLLQKMQIEKSNISINTEALPAGSYIFEFVNPNGEIIREVMHKK